MASATEIEALDRIADILDGTTTGTPILAIQTALEAIEAAIGGVYAVLNGDEGSTRLTEIITALDGIDADGTSVLTQLANIVTELGSLNITVNVADTATAGAVSTTPNQPPDTARREQTARTTQSRNPRKPRVA